MNHMQKVIAFTVGVWLAFMVLAIINAGLREGLYSDSLGDLKAHQLSTAVFLGMIFAATYLAMRLSGIELTNGEALAMGLIWMSATITFEFVAGHYAFGNSFNDLIQDYNIFEGRIWILVPLALAFLPLIMKKILENFNAD